MNVDLEQEPTKEEHVLHLDVDEKPQPQRKLKIDLEPQDPEKIDELIYETMDGSPPPDRVMSVDMGQQDPEKFEHTVNVEAEEPDAVKLMVRDVSIAYVYAPALRPVYVNMAR